jgi:release factor glutamine methyltransferase
MTIQKASKELSKKLLSIYDERESSAITDWVMESLTGWKKLERIINKNEELSEQNKKRFGDITAELLAHRPVQYILNEAWFHGLRLYVDEHVLIPRPETDELLAWALKEVELLQRKIGDRNIHILDVGTGSGCIPVSIKNEVPSLDVWACDISEGALAVARKNALQENVDIEFRQMNFLDKEERSLLPLFDLIISNPPYISEDEKETIDKHVLQYEPHLALFVPEKDSLIFYRHLADFGQTHLQGGGCMLMEIHYAAGEAVRELFKQYGYETELRADMQGHDRMLKAWMFTA